MRFETAIKLLRAGQVPLLWGLSRMVSEMYRVDFLAAASMSGLLTRVGRGTCSVPVLMSFLGIEVAREQAFRAWLELGEGLGELELGSTGVRLSGRWARALADSQNDALAAVVEQLARYRHVAEAPSLLVDGRQIATRDADAELIARASRIAEPFVHEAIERHVPRNRAVRLLEVGCGAGAYIRHAAAQNAGLTALGVELDEEVAQLARRNLDAWGLSQRAEVVCGDIRRLEPEQPFDLITLHSNIYYFAVNERVALFAKLRALLVRNGCLLVTTSCRGGGIGTEALNLYWSLADTGGQLPTPRELVAQLREVGLSRVARQRLIPGEAFFAVAAHR